ncbi:hypothetical protein NDU88_000292 [Pleurodeles waltl]|uniref:Uncharacterized protein n=1 Tax=Pleurodeles waltl TaxID=8319 RepID=A0AAV7TFV3_PLEWA|nr:hypothetical protein NDU88_000292 [Pleurodeles waltl]
MPVIVSQYPPLTTSEDTLGQRTSPNSETTDSEMEPSRPDMLETIESTSLIPYDHGHQRQPLWLNIPEMIQSSSTIIVIQIDPYS